jgi:hypothetical protein
MVPRTPTQRLAPTTTRIVDNHTKSEISSPFSFHFIFIRTWMLNIGGINIYVYASNN